ncbi:hypothetical protein VNO78_17363 [Psophocarpus tetragonolobus]|uniref:BI1-like protein n=1 Tax=Psophocarpus tetragonolobus TaxID=3891 RepID=A0AAN9XL64_PSOTE
MLMKREAESGEGARPGPPPYPVMLENPEMRWAFIRKVYTILTIQLVLTVAVGCVVVFVRPISHFFVSTSSGLVLYIVLIFVPFITLCPLYYYHRKHPLNFILLFIFTLTLAFALGLTCAFTHGRVLLESVILTTAVVICLTLYTFWASKRGHDFRFLESFLFGALLVLLIFGMIQLFFPMGRIAHIIYGVLASIIFSGYIIYDTDNLIKRYSYDQYIWASVALYFDIINLFLSVLTIFRAI